MTKARWRFIGGTIGPDGGGATLAEAWAAPDIGRRNGEKKTRKREKEIQICLCSLLRGFDGGLFGRDRDLWSTGGIWAFMKK